QASTTTVDTLATIDMTTGAYTVVGPTGRTDLQGLASNAAGDLHAAGISVGLVRIDTATGFGTIIGGSFGGDDQTLEFDSAGRLYSCRINLRSVDIGTGATTIIGPTGFTDIRGMAFVRGATCYANCD